MPRLPAATLLIALLLTLLPPTARLAAAEPARPNILLVIGDDMTWRDCGPYGSPDVKTPNIDWLAEEGMRLDAMFTATAMCSPTRQQLYTGIYPVRNGAYPNHSKVYPGTQSLVHHLGKLGYRVGLAGKSHIGPGESFPFEKVCSKGGLDFDAIDQFIRRDADEPYCLIVASNEPHTPWSRGEASAYPPDALTVPPYMFDTPETRAALSKYYAEITFLDGQLGRCLDSVARSGAEERTISIFTSEQGFSLPFGKWTCYELGLKTSFVVRWPGRIEAGSTSRAMTQYVDVVPTLIDAAGGKVPEGLDGRSFLGVLEGKAQSHRDHVFGAHTTRGIIRGSKCYPIRSVRSERFKYIRNLNADQEPFSNIIAADGNVSDVLASWTQAGGEAAQRADFYRHRPLEELYDLSTDPWELHNLADVPEHATIKAGLKEELDRWMLQQGDLGIETEMRAHERQGRAEATSKEPSGPVGKKRPRHGVPGTP